MSAVLEAILRSKVVAIVRLERYDRAGDIARALLEGGISAIEFTLTGAGAYDAIRATRAGLGDAAQIGVGIPHVQIIIVGYAQSIDLGTARHDDPKRGQEGAVFRRQTES